jgi:diguanylate cyclase (GGDEF)-like protein
MLGVWSLPVLLLLPPVYILLAPVPLQLLSQLRVRRSLAHRVAFSIAAIGLAGGPTAAGFHLLAGPAPAQNHPVALLGWLVAGLLAAVVRAGLNLLMVAAAIRAADPKARWRAMLGDRDGLTIEVAQISAGLTVAVVCLVSPWLAPFALPAVLLLLGRWAMTAQLAAAAHQDPKTGLLNAGAFEREANVALARAQRAGTPVVVMLLDLDHFKLVNDEHGHLTGDAVLRAVADALRGGVRPTDLVGRFGGEEFAVLLPSVERAEALQIAERIRAQVLLLEVDDGMGGHVTGLGVSAGVAVWPEIDEDTLEGLLAAADSALYDAKRMGRDQVQVAGKHRRLRWSPTARVPD